MCTLVRSLFSVSICLLGLAVGFGDAARILASVATPSYSHQVAFRTIWKELAKRGHEVVLLTTDPMEEDIQNLRQIDLGSSYDVMNEYNFSTTVSNNATNDFWSFVKKSVVTIGEAQRHQLLLPEVQALIRNSSEHFDLIMLEVVFPIHLGFVERFKVPVIGLTSLDAHGNWHMFMGNHDHPILHPQLGLSLSYPLTFMDKIVSVLFNGLINIYGLFVVNPMMDEIIQQVFGKDSKPITELMKEVDMLFINVNPVLHPIRAVTPNTIMFGGGTHVDTVPKPLPEGIRKFLDDATQGAIYFSLGSNVKSNLIRDELRQVFIETFKELPFKILWKFENEELPNKPDNVMIQKWVPQADVLRHPNIKVFITQCGLQSMEEAIMNHIPLIGLPFFADQPANAIMMHNKGFGVHLDHTKLTKEKFKETIMEVINNPKYKQRSVEIADLLTDVEMTGLEKVVWWTEYVIRNKGAKLLRNPIRDLPFYQYYLLDVIGFVGVLSFIVIFGTVKISLLIYRLVRQMIVKKPKKN
ncbi:UDP-glycosyltransferase UGT5-like isoform X1 [Coccinella septempunctata]|uniref:UDP-glycosyltransferase UGT5-like isoform X1 n=1 Tax=Coccinella septempunctata TaxID=41139 RepID=UPI001D05F29D|nr:UDP-glycosyltransferase UGT5-like isoform X1 [Coccinella septempunctata]